MPTQVAINGFGRTGRATFRAAYDQGADLEWVGINDVMDIEMLAHLLRHDSVYGPFPGKVEVRDNILLVDDRPIPVYSETDPAALPWGDVGAEVVIESSRSRWVTPTACRCRSSRRTPVPSSSSTRRSASTTRPESCG